MVAPAASSPHTPRLCASGGNTAQGVPCIYREGDRMLPARFRPSALKGFRDEKDDAPAGHPCPLPGVQRREYGGSQAMHHHKLPSVAVPAWPLSITGRNGWPHRFRAAMPEIRSESPSRQAESPESCRIWRGACCTFRFLIFRPAEGIHDAPQVTGRVRTRFCGRCGKRA